MKSTWWWIRGCWVSHPGWLNNNGWTLVNDRKRWAAIVTRILHHDELWLTTVNDNRQQNLTEDHIQQVLTTTYAANAPPPSVPPWWGIITRRLFSVLGNCSQWRGEWTEVYWAPSSPAAIYPMRSFERMLPSKGKGRVWMSMSCGSWWCKAAPSPFGWRFPASRMEGTLETKARWKPMGTRKGWWNESIGGGLGDVADAHLMNWEHQWHSCGF